MGQGPVFAETTYNDLCGNAFCLKNVDQFVVDSQTIYCN